MTACHDCERPYGDEHGFPDLVIPDDVWQRISPKGNDGGLLCPSCICKRLHDAGITTRGTFRSGPLCEPEPPARVQDWHPEKCPPHDAHGDGVFWSTCDACMFEKLGYVPRGLW